MIQLTRLASVALLMGAVLLAAAAPTWAEAAPTEGGSASGEKETHAEGGKGGAELLNPVNEFRTDLAIWTLVVFLAVLAVLRMTAWGPISEGLQKREDDIAAQITGAERKHEEAKQLLSEHEKKISAAHEEVRGIIDQGRRDAESLGQQLLTKAREEAALERERSAQQIESATNLALKELAEKSAALAVDLAGKIVGTQLKPADHAVLINKAVAEFSAANQVATNGKSKA